MDPARLRPLPGLDPDTTYRIRPLAPGDAPAVSERRPAPWLDTAPLDLTGSVLGSAGVQAPNLQPEQLLLLHLVAVSPREDSSPGEMAR